MTDSKGNVFALENNQWKPAKIMEQGGKKYALLNNQWEIVDATTPQPTRAQKAGQAVGAAVSTIPSAVGKGLVQTAQQVQGAAAGFVEGIASPTLASQPIAPRMRPDFNQDVAPSAIPEQREFTPQEQLRNQEAAQKAGQAIRENTLTKTAMEFYDKDILKKAAGHKSAQLTADIVTGAVNNVSNMVLASATGGAAPIAMGGLYGASSADQFIQQARAEMVPVLAQGYRAQGLSPKEAEIKANEFVRNKVADKAFLNGLLQGTFDAASAYVFMNAFPGIGKGILKKTPALAGKLTSALSRMKVAKPFQELIKQGLSLGFQGGQEEVQNYGQRALEVKAGVKGSGMTPAEEAKSQRAATWGSVGLLQLFGLAGNMTFNAQEKQVIDQAKSNPTPENNAKAQTIVLNGFSKMAPDEFNAAVKGNPAEADLRALYDQAQKANADTEQAVARTKELEVRLNKTSTDPITKLKNPEFYVDDLTAGQEKMPQHVTIIDAGRLGHLNEAFGGSRTPQGDQYLRKTVNFIGKAYKDAGIVKITRANKGDEFFVWSDKPIDEGTRINPELDSWFVGKEGAVVHLGDVYSSGSLPVNNDPVAAYENISKIEAPKARPKYSGEALNNRDILEQKLYGGKPRAEAPTGPQIPEGETAPPQPPAEPVIAPKAPETAPIQATEGKTGEVDEPAVGVVYRTEKAHKAYKGKSVWGEGKYYSMDEKQAGEMQIDPHRETVEEWTPETGGVDKYSVGDLKIKTIDIENMSTTEFNAMPRGNELKKQILSEGYDAVLIKTGGDLNMGGDQLVVYRNGGKITPAPATPLQNAKEEGTKEPKPAKATVAKTGKILTPPAEDLKSFEILVEGNRYKKVVPAYLIRNEDGQVINMIGAQSEYSPEWRAMFGREGSVKGIGKDEVIRIYEKIKNGTPLTDRQAEAYDQIIETLKDFKERSPEFAIADDLNPGDSFMKQGEKHFVKEITDDGQVKIQNGKVEYLWPGETIEIDRGTLEKQKFDKTSSGDQAVMGGLEGREMPRGPIKQKPSTATDRGTIFDEEGLKTDREVQEGRGQTTIADAEATLGNMAKLDRPAPVGLAVKRTARGTVHESPKAPASIEARIRQAHGIGKAPFLMRLKDMATTAKNLFTRQFQHLDPKTMAEPIDILRRAKSTNVISRNKAATYIRQYTSKLNRNESDHFGRLIWTKDLARSIDEGIYDGKPLPFDFENKTQVKDYVKTLEETAPANVKEAIDARTGIFKAYAQTLVDNGQLPKEAIKNAEAYMRRQILDYYRIKNGMTDRVRGEPSSMKDFKQGFQKKRTGSDLDYNTNILEADYEVLSQMAAKVARHNFRQELKAWSKDVKDKDGWQEWEARPGSMWFETEGLGDDIVNTIYDAMNRVDLKEHKQGIARQIAETINDVVHYKGAKDKMLLPPELIKTLNGNQFGQSNDGIIAALSKGTMNAWKQWVLFNPFRALKYNLNNASGDLDAVTMGEPKVLGKTKDAFSNLLNLRNAKESEDVKEALEYNVIGSSITAQEIPDINKDKVLKELTGENSNMIEQYFDNVKEASTFRENLLRLSAYKYFKQEYNAGRNPVGVSNPKELSQIKDPNKRAAKAARELLGDYGALTEAGQYLRQRIIPFYSWMEINAPRYYRAFKNAATSGDKEQGLRAGAIVAKNVALKAALSPALMILVQAYNHIKWPDEEEKLSEFQRRQMHLIVGKTADGRPITIRFQGALSDALDWFGLADAWYDIQDLRAGKKTWGDQLKEMAKAPAVKLLSAVRPDVKLFAELLTKKRLYPDPFKPMPIRDIKEHALGTLGPIATLPYKMVVGRPMRPAMEEAGAAIGYITPDPGEAIYLDVRNAKYEALDKLGKGFVGGDPKPRANALYYWRQAKLYKDKDAEQKYYEEYIRRGGTKKGMASSLINASPLGGISMKDFDIVLETFDEKTTEKIEKAYEWYLEKMLLSEQLVKLKEIEKKAYDWYRNNNRLSELDTKRRIKLREKAIRVIANNPITEQNQ